MGNNLAIIECLNCPGKLTGMIRKIKAKAFWTDRILLYGTNDMTYSKNLSDIIKKNLYYIISKRR